MLTADTPLSPSDLYGGHKAEAEAMVRSSDLEWAVLRLGGVVTVELQGFDNDVIYFLALLPVDGRLQTVDVRDVAGAFAAATTTDAVREVFLIGGDKSHRLLQGRHRASHGGRARSGRRPADLHQVLPSHDGGLSAQGSPSLARMTPHGSAY